MSDRLSLESRLEKIPELLAQLRGIDTEFKAVSAAFHHHYQLNPPISEERVVGFEDKHQITLPEEYRMFLLIVGNGGAGPDYGLYPLERWAPWGKLIENFPHTQTWSPYEQPEWPPVDIPEGRDFESKSGFKQLWDGSLHIGGGGCDFSNLLVITGPERGNMWLSEMDNEIGFMPYSGLSPTYKIKKMFPFYDLGDKGRVGFLDWYEHWLHMSVRRAQSLANTGT